MAFVLLAKAFSREKEIAIRMACGASTSRLAGAFLIEGLLYGSLAGGVGTIVAFLGTDFIVSGPGKYLYPAVEWVERWWPRLGLLRRYVRLNRLMFGLIPVLSMIRMDPFARLAS
jgi:putative ABC transport system permease protein